MEYEADYNFEQADKQTLLYIFFFHDAYYIR